MNVNILHIPNTWQLMCSKNHRFQVTRNRKKSSQSQGYHVCIRKQNTVCILRQAWLRDSRNYFALIKRRNAIQTQLALARNSSAKFASRAGVSGGVIFRKYNISLRSRPFFAFDRSNEAGDAGGGGFRNNFAVFARAVRFHSVKPSSNRYFETN